ENRFGGGRLCLVASADVAPRPHLAAAASRGAACAPPTLGDHPPPLLVHHAAYRRALAPGVLSPSPRAPGHARSDHVLYRLSPLGLRCARSGPAAWAASRGRRRHLWRQRPRPL